MTDHTQTHKNFLEDLQALFAKHKVESIDIELDDGYGYTTIDAVNVCFGNIKNDDGEYIRNWSALDLDTSCCEITPDTIQTQITELNNKEG